MTAYINVTLVREGEERNTAPYSVSYPVDRPLQLVGKEAVARLIEMLADDFVRNGTKEGA